MSFILLDCGRNEHSVDTEKLNIVVHYTFMEERMDSFLNF